MRLTLIRVTRPSDPIPTATDSAPTDNVAPKHSDDAPPRASDVDTFSFGNVGKYLGLPAAGDKRVRQREGHSESWLNVRAGALAPELPGLPHPDVDLSRILIRPTGWPGKVDVRFFGMPAVEGTKLRITNLRTGETRDVTLTDPTWSQPMNADPSDELAISSSDGKRNADFTVRAGTLRVPQLTSGSTTSPDGCVMPLPVTSAEAVHVERFSGPLFVGEPSPLDVFQGALGDCGLAASYASRAAIDPDFIKRMIKDNGDGTYEVTIPSPYPGQPGTTVKVNGDLYVARRGVPLYGAGPTHHRGGASGMVMWFPLVEKAYAALPVSPQGYARLQNNNTSDDSFSFVSPDNREGQLAAYLRQELTAGKRPVVFLNDGKFGDGFVPGHYYAVIGFDTRTERVKLYNPWGRREPTRLDIRDTQDDGVFWATMEDCVSSFNF